jgi:pimeloyl-ACP methyl ester carboxylesterase
MTTRLLARRALDTARQAWSAAPTRYLARPEGLIAYDDRGHGPLIVAAPSLGDLRQEYRFLVPHLVAAGYWVVTLDLRGLGDSDASFADYTPEAVGSDIVALVEHLDAGQATIIGTSMAAGSAAWAAAERPDLVAGLVLVGPFVRQMPSSKIQTLMLKVLLTRPWGPAAWSRYYKSLYPTSPPADLSDHRAALKANLKEPGRFRALRGMIWSPRAAVEARLDEVRAPVLVVMGTKDPDFPDPAAEAQLVAERLRGSVSLIEGAGHYPHAEMPEETASRMLAFLPTAQRGGEVARGR